MRIRLLPLAVSAFALLLATPVAAHSGPIPVIQVSAEGGFVAPGRIVTALPGLTAYANGLVLTNDAPASTKRPDLLRLYARVASTSKLRYYAKAIHEAAATPVGGWGTPAVADVPSTHVLINFSGIRTDISVYALSFTNGPNVSAAQKTARIRLQRALAALNRYVQTFKPGFFHASQYEAWVFADIVPSSAIGLANPATIFCASMGGTSGIVTDADGSQRGTCTLPDLTVLDEWQYFRSASKSMSSWPIGIAQPTGRCTMFPTTAISASLKFANPSGRWLLATGQAVPVSLRPALPGERPCRRQ